MKVKRKNNIIEKKINKLREMIIKYLPNFVKACNNDKADVIVFHQDSFAANYQTKEYMLLGMAIKYAGLFGKKMEIICNNKKIKHTKKENKK